MHSFGLRREIVAEVRVAPKSRTDFPGHRQSSEPQRFELAFESQVKAVPASEARLASIEQPGHPAIAGHAPKPGTRATEIAARADDRDFLLDRCCFGAVSRCDLVGEDGRARSNSDVNAAEWLAADRP